MARVKPSTTPLALRNGENGKLAMFLHGDRIPGVVGVSVDQDGFEGAVVTVRITARAVRFETEQVEQGQGAHQVALAGEADATIEQDRG